MPTLRLYAQNLTVTRVVNESAYAVPDTVEIVHNGTMSRHDTRVRLHATDLLSVPPDAGVRQDTEGKDFDVWNKDVLNAFLIDITMTVLRAANNSPEHGARKASYAQGFMLLPEAANE
ncbi:AGAP012449-PA [Anopheles gambiae str. PEST]|uniref:AGAP012449-PA n=1 Tax=Anopheles gambiae TaxID=7165 RepID=A0NE12_ANOGA|nr:AGAP012449-PA [Anopheles gambiae str. PEST]